MKHQAALIELVRQLEDATASADWTALARLDAEVAAVLAALPARNHARAADRGPLEQLHAAHRVAARRCDEACAELESRLEEMTRNKDGWMAYAMNDAPGQGAA